MTDGCVIITENVKVATLNVNDIKDNMENYKFKLITECTVC